MSSYNETLKPDKTGKKAPVQWAKAQILSQDASYVGVCDGMRVLSIGIVAWFHIWQQSWLWPGFRICGHELNLDPLIRSGCFVPYPFCRLL